jgi:hypothetical protein
MSILKPRVSRGIVRIGATSTALFTAMFFEDFSTMPTRKCFPDGYLIGVWKFVFNGYGCNGSYLSNFEHDVIRAADAVDQTG